MKIPIVDLQTQYQSLKKEINTAISAVINSGYYIGGPQVDEFEKEFARFLTVRHCISLNSGTDALILGVRALGLKSGDELIMSTNTFVATSLAATENGLKPVFADIDADDYCLDLADLKSKITSRTKAIILVHLYGQPEKITEIKSIIKKTGKKIYLIEDAAQAHGAKYNNQRVGSFGIFSAFSFYPTKNLGAYGDGGALVTNDDGLAKKYRFLKEYGQKKKYVYVASGINSRLDTIQAAILKLKLKYLDRWNQLRQNRAEYYSQVLAQHLPFVISPKIIKSRKSIFHLYAVRVSKRDKLRAYLAEKSISTLVHYPKPLHLQDTFKHLNYKKGDLPVAEKICSEIISLPMYPELKKSQIDYIVKQMSNFYKKDV